MTTKNSQLRLREELLKCAEKFHKRTSAWWSKNVEAPTPLNEERYAKVRKIKTVLNRFSTDYGGHSTADMVAEVASIILDTDIKLDGGSEPECPMGLFIVITSSGEEILTAGNCNVEEDCAEHAETDGHWLVDVEGGAYQLTESTCYRPMSVAEIKHFLNDLEISGLEEFLWAVYDLLED
jgi:hypothetical protein